MEKNTPQERKESEKQNEPQERKEQAQRATEDMLQSFTQHMYNNNLTAFIDNFYKFFEEESKESPEALQQLQDFKKLLEPFRTATQGILLHDALDQIDRATAEAMTKEPEFNLISDYTIALVGIEKQAALFKIKGELLQYIPREAEEAENKSPLRFLSEYEADIIDEIIDSKGSQKAARNSPNYDVINHVIQEYNAAIMADFERVTKQQEKEKFSFTTDKLNNAVFSNLNITKPKENTLINSFCVNMANKRRKTKALVKFGVIDITEEVEKMLSLYPSLGLTRNDWFIYCAISAQYNSGCKYTTFRQIHRQTTNSKNSPSKDQTKKIENSIIKMMGTIIKIDNAEERQAKGFEEIKPLRYTGPLLPVEMKDIIINGKITTAIISFREPPLYTFAREHGQISTVPRCLLAPPISNTETTTAIQSFLLRQIAWMKNGKSKRGKKISYTTIFEEIGIQKSERTKISRAKVAIKEILNHYKKNGFIKNYKEDKSGIEIFYKSK